MDQHQDAEVWASVATDVPCKACRYNLTGLQMSGVCPECAESVAASVAAWDEKVPLRRRAIVRGVFWCHIACAVSLLPLIAAYHVNGRAWLDYGLSALNPPPYRLSNGTWTVVDYDPGSTRPFVWPVVGKIWEIVSTLSLVVICPPIGPGAALALPLQLAVWREDLRGVRRMVLAWSLGLLPYAYFVVWGGPLLEWLMD